MASAGVVSRSARPRVACPDRTSTARDRRSSAALRRRSRGRQVTRGAPPGGTAGAASTGRTMTSAPTTGDSDATHMRGRSPAVRGGRFDGGFLSALVRRARHSRRRSPPRRSLVPSPVRQPRSAPFAGGDDARCALQ